MRFSLLLTSQHTPNFVYCGRSAHNSGRYANTMSTAGMSSDQGRPPSFTLLCELISIDSVYLPSSCPGRVHTKRALDGQGGSFFIWPVEGGRRRDGGSYYYLPSFARGRPREYSAQARCGQGVGGLKTYSSTPGDSKKAVLYIYDIGGYCAQNYQGKLGFQVPASSVIFLSPRRIVRGMIIS